MDGLRTWTKSNLRTYVQLTAAEAPLEGVATRQRQQDDDAHSSLHVLVSGLLQPDLPRMPRVDEPSLLEGLPVGSVASAQQQGSPRPAALLEMPTMADFASLAEMKALAFQEKQPCGCLPCVHGLSSSMVNSELKAYTAYAARHQAKLAHCRVIRDAAGKILGGIQLQCQGDVGDLSMDSDPTFHHRLQPGEVYLEWIGVHPDSTGQGIGSQLLKWAHEFAAQQVREYLWFKNLVHRFGVFRVKSSFPSGGPQDGASFISLEVMAANQGAAALYERKGYIICDPHDNSDCAQCITALLVF